MTKKKEVRGKSKHLPRPRACSTPIVPGRILDAIAIRTSVTSKEKVRRGVVGNSLSSLLSRFSSSFASSSTCYFRLWFFLWTFPAIAQHKNVKFSYLFNWK